MVVREKVAGRQHLRGGSPCMTRDGFFGGGRGATSSEWSSRAGSMGFVDLEQGMGEAGGAELDGASQGLELTEGVDAGA